MSLGFGFLFLHLKIQIQLISLETVDTDVFQWKRAFKKEGSYIISLLLETESCCSGENKFNSL